VGSFFSGDAIVVIGGEGRGDRRGSGASACFGTRRQ
jgi:hypothetical protein